MKILGIIILVLGIAGTAYYGLQAMNQSESFNLLGVDVAVSSANWTPVIVSGIVLLAGLIIMLTAKKK